MSNPICVTLSLDEAARLIGSALICKWYGTGPSRQFEFNVAAQFNKRARCIEELEFKVDIRPIEKRTELAREHMFGGISLMCKNNQREPTRDG